MMKMKLAPSRRTLPCDACQNTKFEIIAQRDRRAQKLPTVICTTCGLVSHESIPDPAELAEYYQRQYRQDYKGEFTPSAYRVLREWKRGRQLVHLLRKFLEPGQSIHEIGAGIGCTVKNFELAGFDASGIEPSEGFREYSRNQLAARVRPGYLDDVRAVARYDMVLLVHVLEHLHSPTAALAKIHGTLKPGGLLYVEVPNTAAPHSAPGKMFHFAHIYNFTASSLKMVAAAAGFEVVRQFRGSGNKNLMVVFRRIDKPTFEIDADNYAATLRALTRFNTLTYHLRPRYVQQRLNSLIGRLAEKVGSQQRLARIVARCQDRSTQTRLPSLAPSRVV